MEFIKISEQTSLYNDLDKKSVREILEDINTEDQKIALAVQKNIPKIEKLVEQIVPRMKKGGRISTWAPAQVVALACWTHQKFLRLSGCHLRW